MHVHLIIDAHLFTDDASIYTWLPQQSTLIILVRIHDTNPCYDPNIIFVTAFEKYNLNTNPRYESWTRIHDTSPEYDSCIRILNTNSEYEPMIRIMDTNPGYESWIRILIRTLDTNPGYESRYESMIRIQDTNTWYFSKRFRKVF